MIPKDWLMDIKITEELLNEYLLLLRQFSKDVVIPDDKIANINIDELSPYAITTFVEVGKWVRYFVDTADERLRAVKSKGPDSYRISYCCPETMSTKYIKDGGLSHDVNDVVITDNVTEAKAYCAEEAFMIRSRLVNSAMYLTPYVEQLA